jgi:hypothetical protein
MSERDPLDELSRALFEAAREEQPRAEVRERARELHDAASALGRDASRARPLALTSTSASESRRARGIAAAVWAGSALAIAAAVLLASALSRHAAPAPALRAEPAERVTRADAAQARASTAAQRSTPATDQPALARSQPEASTRPRPTAAKPPPPATLSEELALLDQARSALSDGDAPRALALLDRYDNKLRAKHLNAEAALLRIEALSKSAHAEEARKRARQFIEMYPDSPLADRARALLGSDEGSAP